MRTTRRTPATADALRERAAQLRAAADAAEARARKRERSDDLRRKVLAGSWLVAHLGPDLDRWPEEIRAPFAAYLTRAHDRAVWRLDGQSPSPTRAAQPPEAPKGPTLTASAVSASGTGPAGPEQ